MTANFDTTANVAAISGLIGEHVYLAGSNLARDNAIKNLAEWLGANGVLATHVHEWQPK